MARTGRRRQDRDQAVGAAWLLDSARQVHDAALDRVAEGAGSKRGVAGLPSVKQGQLVLGDGGDRERDSRQRRVHLRGAGNGCGSEPGRFKVDLSEGALERVGAAVNDVSRPRANRKKAEVTDRTALE